jgi:hypothetical protein
MANFKQGLYTPKHPEKYNGDITKIRYMSSWEFRFNIFLDNNPNILEWASEEIAIPYIKPTDGKIHKYYVDYYIKYKTCKGEIKTELVEIKPAAQTTPSKSRNSNTRLYENITYAINQSKWESAKQFAEQRGWTFRIITEHQLFK